MVATLIQRKNVFLLVFGLCWASFVCSQAASGQQTQAELNQRLLDHPFYLRGCWQADKLKFDGAGALMGRSKQIPFTVSGIDITDVRQQPKSLRVEGVRVAIGFTKDGSVRMPIKHATEGPERIHIEILPDPSGSYSAALDAIFVERLASMVPSMPIFWQPYAAEHWLPPTSDVAPVSSANLIPDKFDHVGVTPPRVLLAPEPLFSTWARSFKVSGTVLVKLNVDQDGMPRDVLIVRPMGLGLDEAAIAAVQGYRFAPARKDGKPITVKMNVEVNFQII